jgi:7-cyano-7-deazaguanine reductase
LNSSKKLNKNLGKKNNSRLQELSGKSLGSATTDYSFSYNPGLLETFKNKNPDKNAWTSFVCTEFTSLCPKTGQPDFARIFVNYIGDKLMVESKSLKLYLFSFRNHGDFHEDCVQKICDDLSKLMSPRFIEVIGEFTPRGGISIFPYASANNGQQIFKKIYEERFAGYAPGKYTCSLSKVYGV